MNHLFPLLSIENYPERLKKGKGLIGFLKNIYNYHDHLSDDCTTIDYGLTNRKPENLIKEVCLKNGETKMYVFQMG